MLDQIHQQRIGAFHVLRQVRAIHHLQTRTAAQRAHRASPREQQCARLQAFHDLLGNALGIGGIRRQRRADGQIRVGAAGAGGKARGRMGTHAVLAFRVPRGHGNAAGSCAGVAGQLLDGVALFQAVRAVEADAAGRSRLRVFRQLRAVGKDHQRVAAVRLVVFHRGEAEPRLGEKACDEVVVRLAKLRDVRACTEIAHACFGTGRVAPRGVRLVRRQHLLNDVSERPILEHLAVALLRGQPEPWHHRQAIAREAAVRAELLSQADQARALGLRTIGQRRDQRDPLAQQ